MPYPEKWTIPITNIEKWTSLISTPAELALTQCVDKLQEMHRHGIITYPPDGQLLNALAHTPPEAVKCVILGQDPYHSVGQAMGLSFSVPDDTPIPPSLVNIFRELEDDLGIPAPKSGDLTRWADHGVLLLNSSLSVEAHKPNSHADLGWKPFTQDIIRITLQMPQPIVYLLWGRKAADLVSEVEANMDAATIKNKFALRSSHPSPYSANSAGRDYVAFMGSKPFSFTNDTLTKAGSDPVDWRL